jgi:tRNA(Leu) C34 or U34 (ribose-2'-O)-methylase TrmL
MPENGGQIDKGPGSDIRMAYSGCFNSDQHLVEPWTFQRGDLKTVRTVSGPQNSSDDIPSHRYEPCRGIG